MRRLGWLAVVSFMVVFPGCGDDVTPPPDPLQPTLENIWPNENGRAWTYAVTARGWDEAFPVVSYATADSVPPAPTIDAIIPLLYDRGTSAPADTTRFPVVYQFQDSIAKESGITAQNLVTTHGVLPLFLPGGAWEKTEMHIGRFGDVGSTISWKFLETNLRPGATFSFQLPIDVSLPTFLHAKVVRWAQVTTPVGVFENGVEVAYLLDPGIMPPRSPVYRPDGGVGYHRIILYGSVVYAPTVGPVHLYERRNVTVGDTLSAGTGDYEMMLTGVKAGTGP